MLFVEGATGQDSSGAPSTNASRLSVGQELAWHRRGVRVKDLKKLVDDAKGILNLDKHHCATSNFNVGSSVEVRDGLFRVQLHTDRDHRLYRFDRVAVHAPDEDAASTPEEGRSARSGLLRTSHRRFGAFPIRRSLAEHMDVVNVLNPRSVEVEVTTSQFSALACKTLSMPLNMHKLAGEMLIPLTTVEERVVHIRDSADAQLLIDSLNPDKKTVKHNLMLPAHGTGGLIQISQGMAIHGSLSTRGTIRRYYWSLDDRSSMWHTRIFEAGAWHHGRTQSRPDEVPKGVAEAEQWIGTDTILERASNGGVLLVLRRGVSFSELLHKGQSVTEFISHNWCGSSVDLIRTLQTASVRWAWICTFALNQHAVPCLSSGIESSPFYLAMKNMRSNGRVIMVLDEDATTLTRIWCVFEVWVSQSLRLTFQMFLPSGELNFFGTDEQSRKVKRRLVTLHLTDAECSVEEDKEMILRLIDESDGGRAAVAWQVECVARTLRMCRCSPPHATFCSAMW